MGPFATNLPSFEAGAFTVAPSIASAFVPIVRTVRVVARSQRSGAITTAIQTTARREPAGETTSSPRPIERADRVRQWRDWGKAE